MKIKEKTTKIAVLGAGLWGAVLADHLARGGSTVRIWEFFPELARSLDRTRKHPHIPGWKLAESITVTSRLQEAAQDAELVLNVLPSAHVRATMRGLRAALGATASRVWIVNASKGVEPKTLDTIGDVIGEEIASAKPRILTLSGPSFAREVARGVPTALLLAGKRTAVSERWRRLFDRAPLRVTWSADRKGVELGGSLKNVLAIACGVVDGLHEGGNTRAALMTQGLSEMGKIMRACGGRLDTAYGLAGIGDLILTGSSNESRNHTLGEALGEGKTLAEALRDIPTVTEGVDSALSAHEIIESKRLDCPLFESVWQVLYEAAPASEVLRALDF